MSLDKKLFKAVSTTTTAAAAAEGLVLHLDANDEDSIEQGGVNDGNTNGTWFDISTHDLNIPLSSDDNNNLKIHYDPSNTNSYSGTGTTLTNLAGSSLNATVVASRFDNDYDSGLKGYFDISTESEASIVIPSGHPLNGDFTLEFWFRWQGTPASGGHRFINESGQNIGFFYYKGNGWRFYQASGQDTGYYGGSSGGIQANVWQHKVITFSGTQFKGYLDGEQIGTKTYTRPSSSLGSFNFGTTNITADKPDCDIGAIRMYDRALTASEVAQNFRAGNNFSYSSTYDTGLALDFDPADIDNSSSTATWTDKVASLTLTESGTINYEKELGNYADLQMADYFGNDSATTTIKDTNGDFVMDFWVNFNSDMTSYHNVLLGVNQSSGLRGILFYFSSTGMELYIYKSGTSSNSMFGNPSWSTLGISNGRWYNLTVRIDASTNIKYFVDGQLKATLANNVGGTHWTAMHNIRLGDDATLGYQSNFKVGDFRIYKGLLTEAQIAQNYLARKNNYPNGNHATNNGATFTYASTPYHFDFVSNDYFRTPSIPITWTSGFAYEIYFKADTNTQSYPISTSGSANPALSWRYYGDGWKLVAFHYKSSSTVDYLSSGATSTGQWYHIVYTANDSGGQIYTNGSLSDSTTNSVRTGDYNDYFDIGRLGGGNYLDGKIGMVKIYAKHLSASEVSANFDATKSTYGLS